VQQRERDHTNNPRRGTPAQDNTMQGEAHTQCTQMIVKHAGGQLSHTLRMIEHAQHNRATPRHTERGGLDE